MRPELNRELKGNEFRDFYWLKEELQNFCRANGISASGPKSELTDRIAIFLETGEIQKPMRKRKTTQKKITLEELSLETVIPKFHFSTYIQDYFKENVGKTYQDVVDAWNAEEEWKKDPSYERKIGAQFEYNQFIRDYFADPKNKRKKREDAIAAWNIIKALPSSNRYQE